MVFQKNGIFNQFQSHITCAACRFKQLALFRPLWSTALLAPILLLVPCCVGQLNAAHEDAKSEGNFDYKFQLRDVDTGLSIPGAEILSAKVEHGAPRALVALGRTDESGSLKARFPAGRFVYEIDAPGYKPWRALLRYSQGRTDTVQNMLEPLQMPPKLAAATAQDDRPGYTMVMGYVMDASTYRPIGGVEIHLIKTGATAISDADGFYSVSVPVAPHGDFDDAETDTLTVHKDGYVDFVNEDVPLDMAGGQLALRKGHGRDVVVTEDYQGGTGIGVPEDEPDPPPAKPLPQALQDWLDYKDSTGTPAFGEASSRIAGGRGWLRQKTRADWVLVWL